MNRDEVQGLQALAQAHGASLTINPHTGMPEAFSLGKVFKSLLPMAAGFALGPGGFFGSEGLFGSALMTGLAVGAGTGLLTGNLGQGLMAGMGAYGGYGLSDVWGKMGGLNALKAGQSSADLNAATFGNQGINTIGNSITPVNAAIPGETLSTNALEANVNNLASSTPQTQYGLTNGLSKGIGGPGIDLTSGISKNVVGQSNIPLSLTDTASKSLTAPTSLYGKYIAAGGTPAQLATTIGGGLLGGVQASDLNPTVNLQANAKTKHVATGVDAQGNPTYSDIPLTAYSPYETLNLNDPYSPYGVTSPPALKLPPTLIAKEGGMIKSYALGGVVGNPTVGGGISDLYNRPEGQTTETISQDGYGIGRLDSLANAESMNTAKTLGYADGGSVDSTPSLNLDNLPALNLNTGATNPGITAIITSSNNDKQRNPFNNAGINFASDNRGGLFNNSNVRFGSNGINPTQQWRTIGMAHGGYLDGQGDGMSDSIPATIEGKQPARLADGEFVVPADVVSHLGNGSSKAGSQRLYSMLDKVRRARTGNVKQGKQINPNQFLPA
jgi:hypothetical protein